MITLGFACLSSLSAGTQYGFANYSPQLAARLSLSSTQTNIIGASANLGVYLSGPWVGRIVDRHGPRVMLAFASMCLLIGCALTMSLTEFVLWPNM